MLLKILLILNQSIITALITGVFLYLLFLLAPSITALLPSSREYILNNPTFVRDKVLSVPIGPNSPTLQTAKLVYELESISTSLVRTGSGHKMTIRSADLGTLAFDIDENTLINNQPYNQETMDTVLQNNQKLLVRFSYDLKTNQWKTESVNKI